MKETSTNKCFTIHNKVRFHLFVACADNGIIVGFLTLQGFVLMFQANVVTSSSGWLNLVLVAAKV